MDPARRPWCVVELRGPMKGGKAGRKRKTSAGAGRPDRQSSGRGKSNTGNPKRAATVAPKKGSRKKSFGGTSSSGDGVVDA